MSGHAHNHGAHGHVMDAVMNTTMSMMTNTTAMLRGMHHAAHNMSMTNTTAMGMDHGVHHNMSMDNATMGMDHGMHGHVGHGATVDPTAPHHGHGGDMGGSDHSSHASAGHQVYFHFMFPSHLLFEKWEITSSGQLAVACIAWCILAIAYEGLKTLREYILVRQVGSGRKYLAISGNKNGNSGDTDVRPKKIPFLVKMFNVWHILLSILQIVQTTLGMLLMLVYMTFNFWLAFSVSLGSGIGYWLFAWNKRSLDQFDDGHCV